MSGLQHDRERLAGVRGRHRALASALSRRVYRKPVVAPAAPTTASSAGCTQVSSRANPPALLIAARNGMAHRCSMRTTAADTPGGIASEIAQGSVVLAPAQAPPTPAPAPTEIPCSPSDPGTDQRSDERAESRGLLGCQGGEFHPGQVSGFVLGHELQIEEADGIALAQPPQLRKDVSGESVVGEAHYENLNRTAIHRSPFSAAVVFQVPRRDLLFPRCRSRHDVADKRAISKHSLCGLLFWESNA